MAYYIVMKCFSLSTPKHRTTMRNDNNQVTFHSLYVLFVSVYVSRRQMCLLFLASCSRSSSQKPFRHTACGHKGVC